MLVIGLTGGIGSGKSTVADLFATFGVPVYKADDRAKILQNEEPLKSQIQKIFTEPVYQNQELNRKLVASLVFSNKELLQKLNNVVHPAVSQDFNNWLSKQKSAYIIKEAAIIFEMGAEKSYDKIILVTAPTADRIQRVIQRDSTEAALVQQRINNQMPDEQKRLLAHYEIENIDFEATKLAVQSLHQELLKLANANI